MVLYNKTYILKKLILITDLKNYEIWGNYFMKDKGKVNNIISLSIVFLMVAVVSAPAFQAIDIEKMTFLLLYLAMMEN